MTTEGPASRWPEALVAALVLAALLLGIADRGMGADEGIWYYVARVWVEDGVPPYQGPVENKTPGIFYLFALSYRFFGLAHVVPRLVGAAALLACCAAVYALAGRLYGRLGALAAALACGLIMASARVDGPETAMTESFLVAFATLAVLQVDSAVRRPGRRWSWMLAAGGLWGAAIAFKQIALVTGAVLLLWAWLRTPPGQRSVRRLAEDAALLVAGGLLVTGVSLLPLLLEGVSIGEYWRGAWLILLERGSGLASPERRAARVWERAQFPLLFAAVILFAALRRPLRARGIPHGPLLGWFAIDLIGVVASGFVLRHHIKQVIPVTALLIGALVVLAGAWLARSWKLRPAWVFAGSLTALTLLLFPQRPLAHLMQGTSGLPAYDQQAALGAWLRDRTSPGDYVYTWGWAGLVQTKSERRSPSRYFNRHFAKTPRAAREIQDDLARRPPSLIVLQATSVPCWLARHVADCCRLVHVAPPGFAVYQPPPRDGRPALPPFAGPLPPGRRRDVDGLRAQACSEETTRK